MRHPSQMNGQSMLLMDRFLQRYPYFQAGYVVLAKAAYVSKSPYVKQRVTKASIYVSDRKRLKAFILGSKSPTPSSYRAPMQETPTTFSTPTTHDLAPPTSHLSAHEQDKLVNDVLEELEHVKRAREEFNRRADWLEEKLSEKDADEALAKARAERIAKKKT